MSNSTINPQDVSLELVVFVLVGTMAALAVRGLIATREQWWPWLAALVDRYVEVRLPAQPDDLRPKPLTPVSHDAQEEDAPLPGSVVAPSGVRVVRSPATPGAPPSIRPAPRTLGAPGAHAENDGADGARTTTAPGAGGAPSADQVTLIRRIAQHKKAYPADEKVATGNALGFKKSGTSQSWKEFSEAWDILYGDPAPPPVLPADDPRSFIRNEDGSLTRIDANGQPLRR